MKKLFLILAISASLFAADYTSMSAQELSNVRGSVPTEDRDAFKSAMQSKMQALSPEERASYRANQNSSSGTKSGSGNMYKCSKGKR